MNFIYIFLILLFVFTLLAVIFITAYVSTNKNPQQQLVPVTKTVVWTENRRGFYSPNEFPPGFDKSVEARRIYSILKGQNLDMTYMTLLDIYSILLCQELEQNAKPCSQTAVDARMKDLQAYGGDVYSKNARAIVQSVSNIKNNKVGQLLIIACDVLEKELDKISADGTITAGDKTAMKGLNAAFYRMHFDLLNRSCAGS
jgi:hypothetical protein